MGASGGSGGATPVGGSSGVETTGGSAGLTAGAGGSPDGGIGGTAGQETGGSAGDGIGGVATGGGGAGGGDQTPGVRIVGRYVDGPEGARFSWSGVSIQARFQGTQATVDLIDGNNQNEFAVVVDGQVQDDLVTSAGTTSYPVVTGLADGVHELVLWRRTEAYYNPTEFLGLRDFGPGGALVAPPPPPSRRLEIVGDSITAGYGNEGSPGCSGTKPENNYLAYGSVAARLLGADLHTIAWSGIGAYRNYNEVGPSDDAMGSKYDLAEPIQSSSTWDFSRYVPQAVIINLGTNDYSTHGDPGAPFVDAYLDLVRLIRSHYADAYVFCLIQQGDSEPAINQVVSTLHQEGDADVESFDINVNEGSWGGCDGHPDLVMHQAMGERLAAEVASVLGW